jgi:hypothetical protein
VLTVFLSLLIGLSSIVPVLAQTPGDSFQTIAKLVGGPIVASDRYIFWFQPSGNDLLVAGYDLQEQQQFTLSTPPGQRTGLSTDGRYVAWIDQFLPGDPPTSRIRIRDMSNGREWTVKNLGINSLDSTSLWAGILCYTDSTPTHKGIFTIDLKTGQEQKISPEGQQPVVRDGVVLWGITKMGGEAVPEETTLHMSLLDGSITDKVIAHDQADLTGYSVSSGRVVWSFYPPATDSNVHAYTISSGLTSIIMEDGRPVTRNPLVSGNTSVWTSGSGGRNYIKSCDLTNGTVSIVVDGGSNDLLARGIVSGNRVVYTNSPQGTGNQELRLISLAPAANPQAVVPDAVKPVAPFTSNADRTYFPETGHSLSFGFQYFWNHSGGLPVFGYPLTEEFTERNRDTGKDYTVQYFERQRFEYHPENKATAYETELGRLGAEDAFARGITTIDAFRPRTQTSPNSVTQRFFPETSHFVSGSFWSFWQSHGLDFGDAGVSYRESRALFGLPLSEEYTDPETGLITQYFERAVFEYHPEFKGTPFEMELRLLGTDVLNGRGWL